MADNVIEQYIAQAPEAARETLGRICAMIREQAPEGTTEILAYGMPCFRYRKHLIGFAPFAAHWSLFPMSGGVIETLANDLKKHETSKGAIRFGYGQFPSAALLKKILRARLAEIEKP